MAILSLTSLLIKETKAAIYAKGLSIASAVGLPVTTWQAGDPTRSLYHLQSEILSTLEEIVAAFIASGFLDDATGIWLKILAKQFFDVDVPEATAGTCTVVLTNTGGRVDDYDPGDLVFKNSTTGKTFTNVTGGHLSAGSIGSPSTLPLTVEADEVGSESSAGVGEIDALVTGILGVTVSNTTAAIGVDEQDESVTRQQCRDKLGPISPNGPSDAYRFIAVTPKYSGTSLVTKARSYSSSDSGDVTLYIAGPSGAVAETDRALVEAAILKWSTPLCITPTVVSASNVSVAVTYTLYLYKRVNKTAAEVKAEVETALEALFASREIGGDVIPSDFLGGGGGALYKSLVESTIRGVFQADAFHVAVSAPSGDTALTEGQVPVLGTVTGTVTFVVDP